MSDSFWRRSSAQWLMVAAAILVAAVYWPGLGGAWAFDDFPNIVNNASLRVGWDSGWEQWRDAALSSASRDLPRPLAMSSFALDHAAHGLDPHAMKATNLAIHVLNMMLVFGLVRALLRSPGLAGTSGPRPDLVAAWCAAAWGLNPINLMAVLFVVQRMESLCHTFVFAGLWLYLHGRLRLSYEGKGWVSMSSGLVLGTGLGVLVKESSVLLPLYAALVEALLMRSGNDPLRPRDRRIFAFFGVTLALPAVIGLAALLPRVLAPGAYNDRYFTLGERLLTEARVLVDYLHWTVLPDLGRMALYHDAYPVSRGLLSPPATLFSIVLLGAMLIAAWTVRRTRPLTALGIAWFFAAHALTATVWPLELVFEHRNYFASLGICLVLGDLLLRMPISDKARGAGLALALLLIALHAGATFLRAREWSDPLRFSTSEAQKHPDSHRATYDLARNLVILSDFRADSPYFEPARQALDRAMQVPNASPLAESAAILFAARTGSPIPDAWWDSLEKKLRTLPMGRAETGSLSNLTDCVIEGFCQLPPARLVDAYLAALERNANARVLHDYGRYALGGLHDPALALTLFEDAVKGAPREVVFRISLARMLIAVGQPARAVEHIDAIENLSRFGQNGALIRQLRDQAGAGIPDEPGLPSR
jgi:hypothetical protein